MVGKDLVDSWNKVIIHLVLARRAWEEHREMRAQVTPKQIERILNPEEQRYLSNIFYKSKFEVLLPRLVDYWRGRGGVDTLIIGRMPYVLLSKEEQAEVDRKNVLFKKF
jgi:hypothetical protein